MRLVFHSIVSAGEKGEKNVPEKKKHHTEESVQDLIPFWSHLILLSFRDLQDQ